MSNFGAIELKQNKEIHVKKLNKIQNNHENIPRVTQPNRQPT